MEGHIVDGIYYENGVPTHRGAVNIDGIIYYAGHDGKLAVGHKVVHGEMTNGVLKRGTYTFDEDGKLVEGSFVAPEKKKLKGKRRKASPHKRKLYAICASAVLFVIIVAMAVFGLMSSDLTADAPKTSSRTSTFTQIFVPPEFDGEVYLCTAPMVRFYKGEITLADAVSLNAGAYAPLTFSYHLREGATAVLEIDGIKFDLDPGSTSIKIDNLLTGEKYNYTVTVSESLENGDQATYFYDGSFATANTNRFIYLPGVLNTRDIGGYMTSYGKRVRQNLLIRGTEIDGLVESSYFLTDKSAVEPFGFKYDFDLRESSIFSGNYKSRLGEDVDHKFYTSPMYGGIFNESSFASLRAIFADLSYIKNYPMYLHCTYGADRTGTIIFLLQGILGVSESDMALEYSLTGFFSKGYEKGTNLNSIYGGLEGYEGDTINEKIEDFLVNTVGVTEEQIERIRNVFLED